MQPLQNKILAEIIDDDVTESGIIIKDYRLKKHKAKVLLTGPKVKHLRPGDAIIYDHNESQPYEMDGKKCVWIIESTGFIARI
jgi:co-chaperonin GroES (HSP10)